MIGIIVGFVLGILGSLIAWFVAIGLLTPAIEIRDSIELIRSPEQTIRYRFAVRNRRIFRNAQDVTIKVRCSYRAQTAVVGRFPIRRTFEVGVDDSWIPLIHSEWYWDSRRLKKRNRKDSWAQYPVPFLDQIPSKIVRELPRDKNGQADLFELLGPKYHGRVSLVVIAYDSWSGTKKLFVRQFWQDSISEFEEVGVSNRKKVYGSDRHEIADNLGRDD